MCSADIASALEALVPLDGLPAPAAVINIRVRAYRATGDRYHRRPYYLPLAHARGFFFHRKEFDIG